MLYFFAMVVFFSWPVLLPQLSHLFTTTTSNNNIRARLARPTLFLAFTALTLLIIHFNTLMHPFTLADNRHYPFYVFRYFLIPFPRKYLLAPLYVLCGWLVILALSPVSSTPTARISASSTNTPTTTTGNKGPTKKKKAAKAQPREIIFQRADTVHTSFILIFLASTALSLITAPLVEPRYFMIPWLIWRLHVPEVLEGDAPTQKAIAGSSGADQKKGKEGVLRKVMAGVAARAGEVEILWYMLINVVTGYMFLYRPFEWAQEPGVEQRFMW